MDREIKKIPHSASWNKHRNKWESRELAKKIRKVTKKQISKELVEIKETDKT